jgi:Mg-chelatase subunit ChlD
MFLRHAAIASALLSLSCQAVAPGAAGGRPSLAFGQVESASAPAPVLVVGTPAPAASAAAATPAPVEVITTPPPAVSSGGRRRRPSAPALPPLPEAPALAPITGTGTIGNPADALRVDGLRFDPDFATNGKVHVAFSLVLDGQDLTGRVDPAKLKAAMAFDMAPPPAGGAYRVLDLTALEVEVQGAKALGRPPLDAVLDIDSSGSMGGTDPDRLRVAAIQRYIDGMRPDDQVAVMDFASCETATVSDPLATFTVSRLLYPFGKDRDAAKSAVDLVSACSNTPLYDSIMEGIGYLAAKPGNRPRALVALSDGTDNASVATIHDVISAAKAHDVLLMMLAFSTYHEPTLQQMVSGSGGYFIGAEDASTLEAQYVSAVRTVNGNAQAIMVVPADKRIAQHMSGRLTATIDGKDYSGTFNAAPPGNSGTP